MGLTDINSVRRGQDDEQADSEERDQLQFSNGSSVSEIRRFEIAFDRPEALYFSGDCVTGEVQISLEDTIHVKGVVVRFVGEAYVNVPLEEEGSEGPMKGAAMWQKRCRNLRTFASRGRRNKVKPSASGMSNHGFAKAETKVGEIKADGTMPAPQANGGHTVKCESVDDLTDAAAATEQKAGDATTRAPLPERTEKGGSPEHGPTTGTEHLQPPSLETVKEEREEDLDRSLEEVRLGAEGAETPGDTERAVAAPTTTPDEGGVVEVRPEAKADEEAAVPAEKPPDEGGRPPEAAPAPAEAPTKEEEGAAEKGADKRKEHQGRKERKKAGPAAAESSGKKSSSGAAAPRRPHQMADQAGGKRRLTAKIRSHEKYFDYKYYVFGHKYSSAREHLSSGAHRFRFSYVLPGKLPSSFHGRYGYVRYFCEASLERAWAASITRKTMFSVSASVDVNREPRAESGAGGHRSTHGCLFCCPRGTVMAEAGVRRRGFVPGERIPLRAHILNVSDRCVKRTRARLMQVVTYHSTNGGRSKVDEVVVTEAVRGQVPRGEADTWDEEACAKGGMESQPPVSIEIPPLPANFKCSEFCKIIDVDYRLDFVVEVEGEPEPLHIRMPIVVGTVPLERLFRTMEMGPRRRSTASNADKVEGPSPVVVPGSSQYLEFPLPRFEQCNWGPRHVEAYFHHEVTRKLNEDDEITPTSEVPGGGAAAKATKAVTPVATAGALPGVGSTLRVHRKGETFAPRYVCYKLRDLDGTANHDGSVNPAVSRGRTSMGELSLSPLSPSHLKGLRSPSEAWIPRDTSETELVSPAGGPSGKGKRS